MEYWRRIMHVPSDELTDQLQRIYSKAYCIEYITWMGKAYENVAPDDPGRKNIETLQTAFTDLCKSYEREILTLQEALKKYEN